MLIVVRDNDKKLIKKGWKTLIVSRECEFCSVFSMCRSNIRNIIKTWVLLVIIRGVDAVSNYAWKLFVLLTYFFFFFAFLFVFSVPQLQFFRFPLLISNIEDRLSFNLTFRLRFDKFSNRDAICCVIELGMVFWLRS